MEQLRKLERRSPGTAVRVDDDTGAFVRMRSDAVEELEQVLHIRHQVREDDVIERFPELELLAWNALEAKLRVRRAGAVDHFLRNVDANADARLQRCQEIARARADLEHARVRRDVEAHQLRDEPVVRAVPALPAGLLAREPVE